MRIVFATGAQRLEPEVTRVSDASTLGDLVAAVTDTPVEPDQEFWIGDERHRASEPVRDIQLLEGTTVANSRSDYPSMPTGWTARLAGGLHAGAIVPVPSTRALVIGRSPHADLTLASPSSSWSHARATRTEEGLEVADTGSTNGAALDGTRLEQPVGVTATATLIAGGDTVILSPAIDETPAPRPGRLHNATSAGHVPFNRPPRPGAIAEPEAIAAPQKKNVQDNTRFPIFTILAPLLLAVVMVLVMGDMRYALFAALSPLIGIGTWFEQRQRAKRDKTKSSKDFDTDLTAFTEQLEKATALERSRLHDRIPDPAIVALRAALPTTRMWERRTGSDDLLALHGGIGDVPWTPPVTRSSAGVDEQIDEMVRDWTISSAPVEIDLSAAGVVGIVGDREGALALGRSLLAQAAVHCGPADLTMGVFCDPGREEEWSWTTWLPHTRRIGATSGTRWLSARRERSEELLRALADQIDDMPTPTVLLLLDSDVLTEGRESTARTLLGHGRPAGESFFDRKEGNRQVAGIVLANSVDQLPAACTVIVDVGEDAEATVSRPAQRTRLDRVVIGGIDTETAGSIARDVARFEDPEMVIPGSSLPSLVRLPPLLGLERVDSEAIGDLWAQARGFSTPVGTSEAGTFWLDLVRDGPHGLVGGTTGSGKSEFLRSFVAGLAARNDPTRLTFILIDFKGGAAFKTLEALPHTIGTVSNLDAQLADRAIRALEAEMRYRMRKFAAAGEGIDNLDAYLATRPAEPMPRLLLVVDEFAQLAKEYPDVLKALMSVGAVGRTLGVHMVLATQRPAGVVNDDILANTNLRVALRVQSRDDSTNVIGVPAAAAIGRRQRGRAFVKLGQDDITPVQTALSTGSVATAATEAIEIQHIEFGAEPRRIATSAPAPTPSALEPADGDDTVDLDLLIDAIIDANDHRGFAPPRKVWPEALADRVDLAGFGATPADGGHEVPTVGGMRGRSVTFALADDPDHQRQIPGSWDLERGNVLLAGIPGSGTSTALASIALGLAAHIAPDDLDLLVLDLGPRDLAPLERLPHTVAYVAAGPAARERQVRLLRFLRAEVERRRMSTERQRTMVVLVDGLATLRDEYNDTDGLELLDHLYRAYADGPALGIHVAVATTRVKSVPPQINEVTTQRWMFRLADPYDYSTAGLKKTDAPIGGPGRVVIAETALQALVATPAGGLDNAVATVGEKWPDAAPKAPVIGVLPTSVTVDDAPGNIETASHPWRIPVGLSNETLQPASLVIYEGEHALISGPPRSGKSSLLAAIAGQVLALGPGRPTLWTLASQRSPLRQVAADQSFLVDDAATMAAQAHLATGPVILLVDDAERIEDSDKSIEGIVKSGTRIHVIAAGRNDDIRGLYSHWTKTVRKGRTGVLLQPNVDFDGDILGARIPRRTDVPLTVGRGYLVSDGTATLIQAYRPTSP